MRYSVVRFTHQGMLNYLAPNLEREWIEKAVSRHFSANAILFRSNDLLKEKFLTHWVDCAKHSECIAPNGSKHGPCNFNIMPKNAYAGCHRYDQAALTVILIREFGPSLQKVFNATDRDLVTIKRSLTTFHKNSESRSCGILFS